MATSNPVVDPAPPDAQYGGNLVYPEWLRDELLRALFHTHTWACPMVQVGLAEVEDSDG